MTQRPAPPKTIDALKRRAQAIAGVTVADLANSINETVPQNLSKSKGWLGELLEHVLGTDASNLPLPDFKALGIELKTLPLTPTGKPAESTFVCTAPILTADGLTWETSTVRRKLAHVLWVPIEAAPQIPLPNRRVATPLLWQMDGETESILRQDWEELMNALQFGEAPSLTASLGEYLHIRPKAANNKARTACLDDAGNLVETVPKGFYLRTCFTAHLLEQHYCFST